MKTALLALFLAATPPGHAADVPDDPAVQLDKLIQCTANGLSRLHLDVEVAASIASLTSTTSPQLAMLITSYKSMADDERRRVDLYINLINDVVDGMTAHDDQRADAIRARVFSVLGQMTARSALTLGNPLHTIEDQTRMNKIMADQADTCETMANTLKKAPKEELEQ